MIIFKRERTPIELVIYGIYTYSRSNSFRKVSKIINKNIKSKIALIDRIFKIDYNLYSLSSSFSN
jgi:hypothetical protein